MRNKRFTAIAAIVMCLVLIGAVQSSAVTLRYDASEQKWKDLAVQRVSWRSGNDVDNDYYGTNCYCFVNWVLEDEGRGSLSGFCYEAYLNGQDSKKVAQYLNSSNGGKGPSASTVSSAFSKAQPGDVVQMRWSYYSGGSSVHTALINGFDDNGVYFFQSHVSGYGVKEIKNSYYTYTELARRFTNPGTRGGFTIYKFGDVEPPVPQPKPPINPGLLRLSSYAYAKSFTLTSGRYTGLYSDKNFTTRLSSSAWTGEDDEDWLLDVDWNDSNVPYARISYPVSNGRRIAYVKLQEVFVNGTLDEAARTAVNGYTGLYIRKNSGQNSNYWIDAGDSVWLLTKEDGWCQVLYPISGGKYRIAWLPESDYDKLFESGPYPEPNMEIIYTFTSGRVGNAYSDWVYVDCKTALTTSRMNDSRASVSVISGSLPDGLSLSRSGRRITLSGTPTRAGTFTFAIRAQNSHGGYTDKQFTVTIASRSNPPTICFTFRNGKAGTSYYDYVYILGGTPPFTVRYYGSLPTGLGLSRSGKYIYLRGTPTRTGSFRFTIMVTDNDGLTGLKSFVVTISNNSSYFRAGAGEESDTPTKPKIATTKLDSVVAGNEFSAVLEAGGTKPITWSIIDGELPEGVIMDETGEIIGIPAQAGSYKFKVQAANSVDVATKKYTLKVLPEKPLISTTVIPEGDVGAPYSFMIETEGEDIKFSKSGKFPKGLKLDKKTGEIYGTPKKAGTYTFKVNAKNKAGKDTVEFTMTINAEAEGGNVNKGSILTSSSLPVVNAAVHETNSENITELYLLRNGAEISDSAEVSASMPLTFRAGELPEKDDEDTKPVISGLKVFVNDEELDSAEIAPDGTFTIPGEIVNGTFTVYASGFSDGEEFETTEIEIQAAGDSTGSNSSESEGSTESSGGCDMGFAGMFMLLMNGIALLKLKK